MPIPEPPRLEEGVDELLEEVTGASGVAPVCVIAAGLFTSKE